MRKFLTRSDKVHLVVMTGSGFCGDSEGVWGPTDEARLDTVIGTCYAQLKVQLSTQSDRSWMMSRTPQ